MSVTYCISSAVFTVEGGRVNYFFEKGKFTEDQLEQAIIELLQLQGYTVIVQLVCDVFLTLRYTSHFFFKDMRGAGRKGNFFGSERISV